MPATLVPPPQRPPADPGVPAATVDKSAARVRRMFGAIAGRYDLMNRLMTGGLDVLWRRRIARADVGAGPALDCCTGTGDLAFALRRSALRRGRPDLRGGRGGFHPRDARRGRPQGSPRRDRLDRGRRRGAAVRRRGVHGGLRRLRAPQRRRHPPRPRRIGPRARPRRAAADPRNLPPDEPPAGAAVPALLPRRGPPAGPLAGGESPRAPTTTSPPAPRPSRTARRCATCSATPASRSARSPPSASGRRPSTRRGSRERSSDWTRGASSGRASFVVPSGCPSG